MPPFYTAMVVIYQASSAFLVLLMHVLFLGFFCFNQGLYKVEKHWYTTGLAGFGVFKFVLKRMKDQPAPPWVIEGREVIW